MQTTDKRDKTVSSKTESLVNSLFKSDDIIKETEIIQKLKKIYNDDDELIKKTYKYFVKRFNAISKHATEFKRKLMSVYQYYDLTKIMKKASEYAAKYNMTPAEYHLFINLVKKEHSGKFNKYTYEERTDMGRALGYEPKRIAKLQYSKDDEKYLQSILAFYKASSELDKKIKINSLTYKDCDPAVINVKYDKQKDNKVNDRIIHPLLAAMFIPKISGFETRMLMTSIPFIVSSIYNGNEIRDYPNRFLYTDIVTDKNQPAYSSMTPYQDLYTRSILQAKIWEGVLQLRNGHFYNFDNAEFNKIISAYPANIFDAPDLLFARDAGNILRRIMNAFSFNPTLVRVTKNSDKEYKFVNGGYKPKVEDDKKFAAVVPMINIRLPAENKENITISLSDHIKSDQWYSKEDDITPVSYEQKIINSEGVLIFYVNRSFNTISISSEEQDRETKLLNRHTLGDHNISKNIVNSLPLMFSSVQKINDMQIEVPKTININGHIFKLRSCVLAESINIYDTKIIGETSSIIFSESDDSFYYNPMKAGKVLSDNEEYDPITASTNESAKSAISTNGVIYIYAE